MRDLHRRSAKVLAIHELEIAGFEVFTPMTEKIFSRGGRKYKNTVPVIQDLLFVNSTKKELDPYVEIMLNLQYRYNRGKSINEPLTVRHQDMERFINAIRTTDSPKFYLPGEITPSMYGRSVRIIGGPLDNYSGRLLSVRGLRSKRLIVEVPGLIAASIEVNPDYIQLL